MLIYLEKEESKMQCEAFVMYAVHDVLLNFNVELQCMLIYNVHTVVSFLPFQYGGMAWAENYLKS